MDKTIIGIDPASTKIAFVALNGDESSFIYCKKLGKSGPEACHNARHETIKAIHRIRLKFPESPLHAFIESPIVGRGGVRTTMVQCFTSGVIQGSLHELHIPIQTVNVSTWKKQVVGHGRASKEDIGEYLRLRWHDLFTKAEGSQDLYDAACIALYGTKLLKDNGLVSEGKV